MQPADTRSSAPSTVTVFLLPPLARTLVLLPLMLSVLSLPSPSYPSLSFPITVARLLLPFLAVAMSVLAICSVDAQCDGEPADPADEPARLDGAGDQGLSAEHMTRTA